MLSFTEMALMDSPLITDGDAAGSGLFLMYYSLANFGGPWGSASLLRSADANSFVPIGGGTAQVTWGFAQNGLGSIPSLFAWDDTSTLQVRIVNSGVPVASASDSSVLNGANMGALIKSTGEVELFQWGTISVASGITTFSHLLRGVRGTDWASDGHSKGDMFVALDGSQQRAMFAISDVNLRRWYKAVTTGTTPFGLPMQAKALQANDLRPYAPIQVNAVFDGSNNLIITWLRQTRIGGDADWGDGVTDVPLSEAYERYEVEILGATGGVKRTLRGMRSSTAIYPRTVQVADWGTPPSTYTVVVYQLSATVGRGFGRQATVPFVLPAALPASYANSSTAGVLVLDAGASNTFRVSLTENVTSMSIINPTDQQRIVITWVQDPTGGWTVAPPSYVSGMVAPTTTANAVMVQSFIYDATTDTWYSEIPLAPSRFADGETPGGSINSSNTSFSLAHTPSPTASLLLFHNGQLQRAGAGNDYTISGVTITEAVAPVTGDILLAFYRYA